MTEKLEPNMFRLVLPLPFGILLVHKRAFFLEEAAEIFVSSEYPTFSGIQIWKQWEVSAYRGTVVAFPMGGENG